MRGHEGAAAAAYFRALRKLLKPVYKELRLPSANTVVQVYLFENQERYERYMKAKYPDLPRRRAFIAGLGAAAARPL